MVISVSGELIGMDYLLSQTGKSTLSMMVDDNDEEADEEDATVEVDQQDEEDPTLSTLKITGA